MTSINTFIRTNKHLTYPRNCIDNEIDKKLYENALLAHLKGRLSPQETR